MSIELTHQQRQAVKEGEEPVRVVDPDSKREYILLRAELYERMRRLLEAEVIDPSLYEFEEPSNPSCPCIFPVRTGPWYDDLRYRLVTRSTCHVANPESPRD